MTMRNKIKYLLIAILLTGCSIFYPPPPQQQVMPMEPSREYYHMKAEGQRCEELKPMVRDFQPLCIQSGEENHYTCIFLKSYYLKCGIEEKEKLARHKK